MFFQQV